MTTKTWRLQSGNGINAVNMVKWAIEGYAFEEDRTTLENAMMCWEGPSRQDYQGLLSGRIPYTVDGDTVVFSVPCSYCGGRGSFETEC